MKNRLSIVVLSSVLLFGMSHSLSAQVVQRGLMLEYNEELAKSPLGGVEVVVRGAPSSVSDASGGFELEFLTQSDGERVSVTRIEKPGYEVFNKEALEQWNINPEEPFRIVMCESGRFKRIRDNYSRVSSESYARQQASEESRLRELLEDGALKEEEYRKELYELKVEYQTKLDDLESYVDRFARIDLSELDEAEREIIRLVQAGDMDGAIARYEAQDLLGKYRAETEDIREIETARESLDEAEQAKREGRDSLFAAVRRQFETYVLAGGEENYEKAGNLLREVALADTTNLEAVYDFANFSADQHAYDESERFYMVLLRAYQPRIDEPEENIVKRGQIKTNLGILYGDMLEYGRAEHCYLSAIEDFSRLQDTVALSYIIHVRSLLALHYNEISDFANSLEYFTEAIEAQRAIVDYDDDESILALSHLYNNYGNLCRNLDRFEEAGQAYEEAVDNIMRLKDHSSDEYKEIYAAVNNNQGTLYFRLNRMAEAEEAFKMALDIQLQLYDKNPDAFSLDIINSMMNLALVYQADGAYDKAESSCLEALRVTEKLFREFPDIYRYVMATLQYNLGNIYRESGRYESAEEYSLKAYENYLILSEDNPGAFRDDLADIQNNLGNIYWLMNDHCKAEKYYLSSEDNYRCLYEENPEAYMYRFSITLNNLGVMYANSGQYEKAESYYLRLLDMKKHLFESAPDAYRDGYASALYNLASLYFDNSRYAEAADYFDEASENYERVFGSTGRESYLSRLIDSYYFQGMSHYYSKQYVEAARSFASMCKLDENLENCGFKTTSILNMLAYSYAFSNDFPSAVRTIDRAIDMDPQNTNLYDSKGEILLMQGDRDGAMKTWEKIMELDPSFAEKHPNSVLYSKLFKETAE